VLPESVAPEQAVSGWYYLRDDAGRISGPFRGEELRRRAASNQLFPSWHVSPDRVRWTVAAKVPKLFDVVESALARQLPPGKRLRDLTPAEQVGLVVDRFVLRDSDFLARFPFLTPLRRFIARWLLPRTIVLAQVTASGARYVQFDPGKGTEKALDQSQVNRVRAEKVGKSSLFPLLALGLAIPWAVWVIKDFSLSWAVLKTLLVSAVALAGKVRDVRRTKVLVGYDMDAATRSRLQAVRQAFGSLSHSSRVWLCRLEEHRTVHEWKQSAGMDVKVSRMPAVVFSRAIPNVETNVRVVGLTYQDKAVYFFPENILVKEGEAIHYVDYPSVQVWATTFDVNDTERGNYPDAEFIGYTYRFPNLDGSPDRRYAHNPQDVPIYRFGRLTLALSATSVELLLTSQAAAREFQEAFFSRPAVPESALSLAAADGGGDDGASDGEADGEGQQSFKEWMEEVVIPALAVARAVPRPVWMGVFLLVALILAGGGIYYTVHVDDIALERADGLYDAGKRGEAAALYRQHPRQLLRPDGGGRYLRRLIEYDVEKGDLAEARGWIEKSLEAGVKVEFNSPEAADMYHQLKGDRDRRAAQARAEEEARRKAAAGEEERRHREERERAEEERRRRDAEVAKLRAEQELRLRAEQEARERAEREARERAEREKAERDERRRKEEIARLDQKATPHLRYAKKLIDQGMSEKAKGRLEEIIRDFPGTSSAEAAKQLLKDLGKK
jgi:hypothetical protein